MIDKRRKYIIVLDIETANSLEDAFAYDIGFVITDKHGNIYERFSYMVAELFMDYFDDDIMKCAYYAEKLNDYWKGYKNKQRQLASIYTIRKKIREKCEEYNIKEIYAYNAFFDLTGCNRTIRYLTKSFTRYFFPYGTKIYCIWHMATQTICKQKGYLKFCLENNLVSEKGNIQTSAEAVYKYISKNPSFKEEHTGLEDVIIETEILKKCFAQHKKMDKSIKRNCWQIPQKDFREYKKKV